MTRGTRTIVVLVLGLAGFTGISSAAQMDFQLAAAGTNVPYSQLVDAIPTQWELFTQPTILSTAAGLPETSAYTPITNLAEPGRGNPNPVMLGQIVALGSPGGADRGVWGVYDRMALIPAPIVLYFDSYLTAPVGIRRPYESADYVPILYGPGAVQGEQASNNNGGYFLPPVPVPEPASLLIAGMGLSLLVGRRRQHAQQSSLL